VETQRTSCAPAAPRRRVLLGSLPAQCALALCLFLAVCACCWGVRGAIRRRGAEEALSSRRGETAAAKPQEKRLSANAAPLWLRAAERAQTASKGCAGPETREVWDLVERAAAVEGCRFAVGNGHGSFGSYAALNGITIVDRVLTGDGGPGDHAGEPSLETLFPRGSELLGLAGLLASASVDAAHAGDMALSCRRLGQGFVLSRHLCGSPRAAAFGAAVMVDGTMLQAAGEVLAVGGLPLPEAKRLSAELGRPDFTASLRAELSLERERLLDGGAECEASQVERPGGRPAQALGRASGASIERLVKRVQGLEYAIELLRAPWRQTRERVPQIAGEMTPEPDDSGPSFPFLALQRVAVCRDDAIARRSLLRAALAVEQHRAQHGVYPARLCDARGEGLAIPVDVYSGTELLYEQEGGRYRLLSAGHDGVVGEALEACDDIVWMGGRERRGPIRAGR